MKTNVFNLQRTIPVDVRKLKKDVITIKRLMKLRKCRVDVWLRSDEIVKELNKYDRGVDKSTDILSYPDLTLEPGKPLKRISDVTYLGEMVLGMGYVAEQAKKEGKTLEEHIVRLLIHGLCHLVGYDHEEYDQYKVMRSRENYIMRKWRKYLIEQERTKVVAEESDDKKIGNTTNSNLVEVKSKENSIIGETSLMEDKNIEKKNRKKIQNNRNEMNISGDINCKERSKLKRKETRGVKNKNENFIDKEVNNISGNSLNETLKLVNKMQGHEKENESARKESKFNLNTRSANYTLDFCEYDNPLILDIPSVNNNNNNSISRDFDSINCSNININKNYNSDKNNNIQHSMRKVCKKNQNLKHNASIDCDKPENAKLGQPLIKEKKMLGKENIMKLRNPPEVNNPLEITKLKNEGNILGKKILKL